jgi:hypothetical protein
MILLRSTEMGLARDCLRSERPFYQSALQFLHSKTRSDILVQSIEPTFSVSLQGQVRGRYLKNAPGPSLRI